MARFVREPRLGMVGSLCVCRGSGPVDRCLPLVLARAAGRGFRGSVVLAGDALVGLGCPAEGVDAGRNSVLRIGLRGGHMPLRRGQPLAECSPDGSALALGFQLVNPCADGADALPDLLPATRRRLWLVHTSSMPALGDR
jgi:hypothetical protein